MICLNRSYPLQMLQYIYIYIRVRINSYSRSHCIFMRVRVLLLRFVGIRNLLQCRAQCVLYACADARRDRGFSLIKTLLIPRVSCAYYYIRVNPVDGYGRLSISNALTCRC